MSGPERSDPEHRSPAASGAAPPDGRDPAATPEPAPDEATPTGAVIITTLLAAIILVFWFGMYALNLVRS